MLSIAVSTYSCIPYPIPSSFIRAGLAMHHTNSADKSYQSVSYINQKLPFHLPIWNCHPLFLFTWEFSKVDFVLWLSELAPPACLVTYSESVICITKLCHLFDSQSSWLFWSLYHFLVHQSRTDILCSMPPSEAESLCVSQRRERLMEGPRCINNCKSEGQYSLFSL